MKKGFTLAEILITIGIIGIVAVLTIPNMITNYQKKVTASKLKQTYAIFNQAIKLSIAENGELDGWDYTMNATEFYKRYFANYLSGVSGPYTQHALYGLGTTNHSGTGSQPQYYGIGGVNKTKGYNLKNGTYFLIALPNYWAAPSAYIFIDLNGKSGPNVMGRDGFVFAISNIQHNNHPPLRIFSTYNPNLGYTNRTWTRTELIGTTTPPYGMTSNCEKENRRNSGMGCADLIRMDGWKISKDYPW